MQRVRKRDVSLDKVKKKVAIQFKTRKNDQDHVGHVGYMYGNGGRYCPFRLTQLYLAKLNPAAGSFMLPEIKN